MGTEHDWGYPTKLTVTHQGHTYVLKSPEDANYLPSKESPWVTAANHHTLDHPNVSQEAGWWLETHSGSISNSNASLINASAFEHLLF